ncbi:DUF3024 domain-containing protein [Vibrio fluvialis]|uniref:DUF3024 domain-containing protein n=1 Tax=Vibrio fluvialis TaxID=676 RepID=UPI001EEA3CF8|nr:DUF3024 domain-containing protein [Vibrio fluvialis]EKO3382131.1 DUF3024 domain-containing protein [Vibrio fluvialis]MCG6373074.1 DUF3024 domain-containing protein [Vibrio fluvialis]
MAVISLLQRQIERRAELVCNNRNQSLPAELGKSGFESIENGVQFIQSHFKLDSAHCDYTSPVAKVIWEEESRLWALYVPSGLGESPEWMPYPYLSKSGDLTALIREVEKDPKSYFWS